MQRKTTATCNNMDTSQKYSIEQKQPKKLQSDTYRM